MNKKMTVTTKISSLRDAAIVGAHWMRWWIENNECDCQDGHICGKTARMEELRKIRSIIAASKDEEKL